MSGSRSYRNILKSSAVIGAASGLNIAIGIVRTKVIAVLLGPAGFGLVSLYGSILDLSQNIAGMGVSSSGVRQIAAAAGSGDCARIARTLAVMQRTAMVLGVAGAAALIALRRQVSAWTFGNDLHGSAVALLSVALLLQVMAGARGASLQGLRRISDLAKLSVVGALFGTAGSIGLVYALGADGVAPSLLLSAAVALATATWFARRVRVQPAELTRSEAWQEAASLLKLGFAFMASGFSTMGAAYAARLIVVRHAGLEAAGLYQSAWTLGGLYVGFILNAMGTDFYPRLVAVADDHSECNRLVNEQTHISLLLAGPGVIATLAFAPLVISLFYSAKFGEAVEPLRWICLGVALRVIIWPMGFIIVAMNRQVLFFGSDLAWTVSNVSLTWLCVNHFGLAGAGIAFFGSYLLHGILICLLVRRLSGFAPSRENTRTGSVFVSSIALVFLSYCIFPPSMATGIGVLAAVLSSAYSVRTLVGLISVDGAYLPALRLLLTRLGVWSP